MTGNKIPPGFTPISDNHRPPKGDTKYEVQFRNGFVDDRGYTASQLVWIHDGRSRDVVAVRDCAEPESARNRPKNGSYT